MNGPSRDPGAMGAAELFRCSRYLALVPIGDGAFVFAGHGVFGRRRRIDTDSAMLLRFFAAPHTLAEALRMYLAGRHSGTPERSPGPPGLPGDAAADPTGESSGEPASLVARNAMAFLRRAVRDGWLVSAEADEDRALRESLRTTYGADATRAYAVDAIEDTYEPLLADLATGAAGDRRGPLRILLLGWCFLQAVRADLLSEGERRGFDVTVAVDFPGSLADKGVSSIPRGEWDAIVLQLSDRLLLSPILDGFAMRDPAELESRLMSAERLIGTRIGSLRDAAGAGPLLIVQGVAAPQLSPLGWLDGRHPVGVFEAVRRLNRVAREHTRTIANALFLDEEVMASRWGKRALLDDHVSTFSHHGALTLPAEPERSADRAASFGLNEVARLPRLLAGAILDAFDVWKGDDVIRVVAVDLDGTLWPGEIADPEFDFAGEEMATSLLYGRYGGLHEALRVLQARGVLLAVVSRNTYAQVLEAWRPRRLVPGFGAVGSDLAHVLGPEDFVRLEIGWGAKSAALGRLAHDLGVETSSILFIDDDAVERAEVRHAHPQMWVLGDDMNRVRESLLTSPRLQVWDATPEAKGRADSTRARLMREAQLASLSETGEQAESFLGSLDIEVAVWRVRGSADAGRISELLRRTSQFNTTGIRLSASAVAAWSDVDGHAVFAMDVRDRFAAHGLVGVAILEGALLRGFAMSCRVISLEPEVALLRACKEWAHSCGAEALRIRFVETDRNLPARRLLRLPGVEPDSEAEVYRVAVGTVWPWPTHLATRDREGQSSA